jgi:hypothetical protein
VARSRARGLGPGAWGPPLGHGAPPWRPDILARPAPRAPAPPTVPLPQSARMSPCCTHMIGGAVAELRAPPCVVRLGPTLNHSFSSAVPRKHSFSSTRSVCSYLCVCVSQCVSSIVAAGAAGMMAYSARCLRSGLVSAASTCSTRRPAGSGLQRSARGSTPGPQSPYTVYYTVFLFTTGPDVPNQHRASGIVPLRAPTRQSSVVPSTPGIKRRSTSFSSRGRARKQAQQLRSGTGPLSRPPQDVEGV